MSDKMRLYILVGIVVLVIGIFYLGISAERTPSAQGSGSLDQSLSLPSRTELNGSIAGESVQIPHDANVDQKAIAPEAPQVVPQ